MSLEGTDAAKPPKYVIRRTTGERVYALEEVDERIAKQLLENLNGAGLVLVPR
jgi:tRNA A37 methylthiotransferase MiaB